MTGYGNIAKTKQDGSRARYLKVYVQFDARKKINNQAVHSL